jgi:uncharacterized membrane protein YhfC
MALIGGLALLTWVNVLALAYGGLEQIPPEQRPAVAAQLREIAGQPAWTPLLGAWERLWTVPVHVALSVVVLQAFRRGSLAWLWLAILAHGTVNFTAVGLLQVLGRGPAASLIVEGVIAAFGLLALAATWALRDRPRPTPPVASAAG